MQHSSSNGGGVASVGNGGVGCIVHAVSRYDTLAGVAIKYGVEVADIKRMNGLTTDLQMFALKSLQIPLPGRHPPSPIISNDSNGYHTQGQISSRATPPNRRYTDSFSPIKPLKLSSSPQRNISSSITSLRDYYGLPSNDQKRVGEGFEMTNTPLGLHRKSKSEANGFSKISKTANVPVVSDKSIEKLVRRRKSEVDLNNRTPEDFAALQPKMVNHTATEPEPGAPDMVPLGSKDSPLVQGLSGVRKSSSAPTFLPSETNNNNNSNSHSNTSPATSSIWPVSLLNFTADLQSMSIAAIASPLFDGLPKPSSGRKNKAARD